MTFQAGYDSIRGVFDSLGTLWSSRAGRFVRAVIVLLIALSAVRKYTRALDEVYAIRSWLFWQLARLWFYCFWLSAACVSVGHLVVSRLLRVTVPALEMLVYSMATGLVLYVMAMYAGGFLGWYRTSFAFALPIVMVLLGARSFISFARSSLTEWRRRRRAQAPSALGSAVAVLAAIFGVIGVVFVYLPLITPDSINFDAAWCHLTVAQDYARAGRIVPFVADYARNHPHLAGLVHTWGWLLPGQNQVMRWTLPLHTEFSLFLWSMAGIAATVRWLVHDTGIRSTWAAFFLFPAIFVYDSNIGGAADHFLAFFAPPLFLAAARAARRFDPAFCVLTGVFAAGSILTKYQGGYLIAGCGLLLLGAFLFHHGRAALQAIRVKYTGFAPPVGASIPSLRSLWTGGLLIVATGALLTSPHFLRNWLFHRNPVYPFMQDFFKNSTPTVPNAAFLIRHLFADYHWRPEGTFMEKLKDSYEVFFDFSLKPHYSFTRDVPNFGSLFTFTLPLLFFVRRSGRIWLGAIAASGALMMWAMTFRVDRNLQGFTPILVAVTAALLIRAWELGWTARAGVVALVGLQVIWGGDAMFYSQQSRLKAAMDYISLGYKHRALREKNVRFRSEYLEINKALPANAKVLLHNSRRSLGIEREILLDWPGQQGLITYEGIQGSRQLYDYFRSLGITHLLHTPRQRGAASKLDEVLFTDFIQRYGKNIRRAGAFELVDMPPVPPPQDAPYHVLAIGMWGYKDGLYPVETMNVYEGVQRRFLKFPAPAVPLPRDDPERLDLLARARAALVGRNAKPSDAVKGVLSREFFVGVSYGSSFTLYLRTSGDKAKPGHFPDPAPSTPEESGPDGAAPERPEEMEE
jgi:hypothetical protein